jgi:recombination protein RecA
MALIIEEKSSKNKKIKLADVIVDSALVGEIDIETNNSTSTEVAKVQCANVFTFKKSPDKKVMLDQAITCIEKEHGKGTIMRLSRQAIQRVPVVSTGILELDLALGAGGIPVGRIVEIYGPESSGKTTLTLFIAAQFQKQGATVAFVDAEHALDTDYASKLGVDVPNMLISQPDNGEQALEIVDTLSKSGAVDLIIVDSVAALTPKAEIEGDMGASHMGLQARLMSQALRKITASTNQTKCTVIFINQLRMKIGVMFGNPETTTGGNALKFYASVRIDIRKGDTLKDGEIHIGNKAKIKVVKNKIAPPFKEAHPDIIWGQGYSQSGSVLDMAASYGVVERTGAWYSYKDNKIGQGRENSKIFLDNNPDIRNEMEVEVLRRHFAGDKPAVKEKVVKEK